MKKIFYIANIRLPTEKAHGIQIMKMCEAFSFAGADVELIVPMRHNTIKDDSFDYYKVKRNFRIRRLPCLDLVRWGRVGFWIELFTFAESVVWYSLFKKNFIFYTRDEFIATHLRLLGKIVIWEGHMGQTNWMVKFLISLRVKMVMITEALRDLYVSLGANSRDIIVASDGVDLEQFSLSISKSDARKKVGFRPDSNIVLYTGHLYSWKGADTLAQAARSMPVNTEIIFVGGTDKDQKSFVEKYGDIPTIKILGKKPHEDIPFYLKTADILVIPNSNKEDISKLYTSPMKLFEYMASCRPIIASDLPSLREIVDESTVYFFTPDNSGDLASAIQKVLNDEGDAKVKAEKAFVKVREYSWKNRAQGIINFIFK